MLRRIHLALGIWFACCGSGLLAQNSSLYQVSTAPGQPLTLENCSSLYHDTEPFKTFKKQDSVQIIVTVADELKTTANLQRRKTMSLEAVLKNWVKLDGGLKPAAQSEGAPTVSGTYNGTIRDTSDLQTANSLKFRIGATITDVRPNGFLVLEGHAGSQTNDENWIYSISGIADPADILPNRTILSDRLTELRVKTDTDGQIRDSYRRGWVTRAIDRFGAF